MHFLFHDYFLSVCYETMSLICTNSLPCDKIFNSFSIFPAYVCYIASIIVTLLRNLIPRLTQGIIDVN